MQNILIVPRLGLSVGDDVIAQAHRHVGALETKPSGRLQLSLPAVTELSSDV